VKKGRKIRRSAAKYLKVSEKKYLKNRVERLKAMHGAQAVGCRLSVDAGPKGRQ
jgi:hypothetical protein